MTRRNGEGGGVGFVHTIRVRYGEVDMQGIVFNAHWLAYFDDAITQYFRHLGYDPQTVFTDAGGFDMVVVRTEIEWKDGAGFDEDVAIEVRPTRLGRASFDVGFEASVDGRSVCEATITYVSIRPGKRESVPIPDGLRTQLEADLEA